MLPEADIERLGHMRDAAQEAYAYTQGKSLDDLHEDRALQHILQHCLLIIGEAATCVTPTTQAVLSEVRWSAIRGMRNRLVHAYFAIDLETLWRTAVEDLPVIIQQLSPWLPAAEE